MTFDRDVFRERLTEYLDDRLSAEDAQAFLAWLERHPDLWKEAESARRAWALLGHYRDEPVPEGFSDRVLARVAAGRADHGGAAATRATWRVLPGGRRRAVAVAAAVVLALGAGVLWGRRSGPTDATPTGPDALAALDAVPATLLDRLDADSLVQLASLSDEEFDLLLAGDAPSLSGEGG